MTRMKPSLSVALRTLSIATGAHAQSNAPYPNRAIRLIVPQAQGSASDNVARFGAVELAQALARQIVVDNRPGGALLRHENITWAAVIKKSGAKID